MEFVRLLVLVIVQVCFVQVILVDAGTFDDVNGLYKILLNSDYNKNVLPSTDTSTPLTVNMTFSIINIKEFDEVNGKFSVTGYLMVSWIDHRMTWKPFEHNHTYFLRFPLPDVWTPPITLVNPYDKLDTVGGDSMSVIYVFDGTAHWSPGDIFSTICNVDVTYYPFDTQVCVILFNCWGYGETEINLQAASDEVNANDYYSHGTWELLPSKVSTVNINTINTVVVNVTIRRRPDFVVATIIAPTICVVVLDILVFMLPVECGERVSFSITILLALAVFLTLVGETIPQTSKPMSALSYVLLAALGMSTLSCFMTVACVNIYYLSDDRKVPICIQSIVRLFTCKQSKKDEEKFDDINENGTTNGKLKNGNSESRDHGRPSCDLNVSWQEVSHCLDKFMIVFNTIALVTAIVVFYVFTSKAQS